MDNFRYSNRTRCQVGGGIIALGILTVIHIISFLIFNVWVTYIFTFLMVALLIIITNGLEFADKEKNQFRETDNGTKTK